MQQVPGHHPAQPQLSIQAEGLLNLRRGIAKAQPVQKAKQRRHPQTILARLRTTRFVLRGSVSERAGLTVRSGRDAHRADRRSHLPGTGNRRSRPGALGLHHVRVSSRLLVQAPGAEPVQMGIPAWPQPRLVGTTVERRVWGESVRTGHPSRSSVPHAAHDGDRVAAITATAVAARARAATGRRAPGRTASRRASSPGGSR